MGYHCVTKDKTYLVFVPGHAGNLLNQVFSKGVLSRNSCDAEPEEYMYSEASMKYKLALIYPYSF